MTTVDNNTIERRQLLAGIINSSSDIFNTVLQEEHNLRAEEGGDYKVADALTPSILKTLLLNNLEEEYNKNNMLTIEEQFKNAINKIENINVNSKNYIFNSIINGLNTTIVGGKNKRTKRTKRTKITNRSKIRGGKNKTTKKSKKLRRKNKKYKVKTK